MGGEHRKRKWNVPDDFNCNRIVRAGFMEVTFEKNPERNANHASIW